MWIEKIVQSVHYEPPPADFYLHLAACAACQGAIISHLPWLLTLVPAAGATECDMEIDLAGFMEYEAAAGTLAALYAYPAIWHQLLHDPRFAETYYLTRLLVDAEQRAEFVALSHPDTVPPFATGMRGECLHIARTFLNDVLMSFQPLQRGQRGSGTDETVLIDEDASEDMHLTLSVQQHADDAWNIKVAISPVISGQVVLTLGENRFQAPFDADGIAVVPAIPAALLTMTDGPDLIVSVEATDS